MDERPGPGQISIQGFSGNKIDRFESAPRSKTQVKEVINNYRSQSG
jgi:hypothetical protein